MRYAFFGDLHGNAQALDAVLRDIGEYGVDGVFCTGDALNPYPGTSRIWRRLRREGIPLVRGNHEEYLKILWFGPPDPLIHTAPQFLPLRFAARLLPAGERRAVAELPLTLTIPDGTAGDLLLCHGTPGRTRRSIIDMKEPDVAREIAERPERVIVAGHYHYPWSNESDGKLLVLAGSAGLPLRGDPRAEYLILHRTAAGWKPEHRKVAYNRDGAVGEAVESGFLENGGPVAWLMLDELLCAEPRLVPFLKAYSREPADGDELSRLRERVRAYLAERERLPELRRITGRDGP